MSKLRRLEALEGQTDTLERAYVAGEVLAAVQSDTVREIGRALLFALPEDLRQKVEGMGARGVSGLIEGLGEVQKPGEEKDIRALALRAYVCAFGGAKP